MNKTTSMEKSIFNSALSIGFCLLISISFSNKITAQVQSSGATQEELKEFIKLAQAKGETPHIDIKVITKEDAERYMEIKMKMTNEQKEQYAEYKLPPPPPPTKGSKSTIPNNVKYYINGKKATLEEVEKLTPDLVESVDVNKQKEIPEIRITLKS